MTNCARRGCRSRARNRPRLHTPDTEIWTRAAAENRIVVSKDEDFFHLANRTGDTGRLLWVRIGNCRNPALLSRFATDWPSIQQTFASGQRIVELR